MAGGALGATPSQSGQVANTSSGFGLPMAPGTDQAIQQAQSNFQSQSQAQAAPTSTGLQFGTSGFGTAGDPMQQQMQSNQQLQNPYAQGFQPQDVPASQMQPGFNPFTSERMGALRRQDSTFSDNFGQQPSQPAAGLNTLTGLYSGSGDAGIDPRVQQAKQQGFGFGGAYGQQAQSRMQPRYQQPSNQFSGLQSLLSSLIGGYQQPQQRYSQMPQYRSNALGYRPSLSQAQQSLSRTATTKAEAQAAAEAAARAKLEAEMGVSGEDADFLRWQRQQYEASRNSFNSGG